MTTELFDYDHHEFYDGVTAGLGAATALLHMADAEVARVEDTELRESLQKMLSEEHISMGGACATGVAAALRRSEELTGKTVVISVSGRNISLSKLRELLEPSE